MSCDLHLLIRLSVHMCDEDYAVLQATLSPNVLTDCEQVGVCCHYKKELSEPLEHTSLPPSLSPSSSSLPPQGWEEQTDAAITHLLRTTLARSTRDQSGQQTTSRGLATIECSPSNYTLSACRLINTIAQSTAVRMGKPSLFRCSSPNLLAR